MSLFVRQLQTFCCCFSGLHRSVVAIFLQIHSTFLIYHTNQSSSEFGYGEIGVFMGDWPG